MASASLDDAGTAADPYMPKCSKPGLPTPLTQPTKPTMLPI